MKADLGIVLVHGIGNQQHGSLLRTMGNSLSESMADLARPHGYQTTKTESVQGLQARDPDADPASTVVTLSKGDRTYTVRISEAVWSDCFERPSALRVILWAVRNLPAAAFLLSPDRRDKAALEEETQGPRAWFRPRDSKRSYRDQMLLTRFSLRVITAAVLLTFLFRTFVTLPGLALLVVLAAWGYLRSDRSIAGHVAMAASAAAELEQMTKRVRTCTAWAEQRSQKIVLVAHSQGGFLAHAMLTAEARTARRISGLIGVGSGLKPIWLMQQMRRPRMLVAAWLIVASVITGEVVLWQLVTADSDDFVVKQLRLGFEGLLPLALPLALAPPPDQTLENLSELNRDLFDSYVDVFSWVQLITPWHAVLLASSAALMFAANRLRRADLRDDKGVPTPACAEWWEYSSDNDLVGRMLLPELTSAHEISVSASGHPVLDHLDYFSPRSFLPFRISSTLLRHLGVPASTDEADRLEAILRSRSSRRRVLRWSLLISFLVLGITIQALRGNAFGPAIAAISPAFVLLLFLSGMATWFLDSREARALVSTLRQGLNDGGAVVAARFLRLPTRRGQRRLPAYIAAIAGALALFGGLSANLLHPSGEAGIALLTMAEAFYIYLIALIAGYRPWATPLAVVVALLTYGHLGTAPTLIGFADTPTFLLQPANGIVVLCAAAGLYLSLSLRPGRLQRYDASTAPPS